MASLWLVGFHHPIMKSFHFIINIILLQSVHKFFLFLQSTYKMKKLFSKIETKIDPALKESKGGQSLVGKVFQIGKQTVTVEDIIAEGKINFYSTARLFNINPLPCLSITKIIFRWVCHCFPGQRIKLQSVRPQANAREFRNGPGSVQAGDPDCLDFERAQEHHRIH